MPVDLGRRSPFPARKGGQGVRSPSRPRRQLTALATRFPPARWLACRYERRPFLTFWAALAAGMVLCMILFGLDAGMTLRQHATLAAVTVGAAWLCTWIVFLEDAESDGG